MKKKISALKIRRRPAASPKARASALVVVAHPDDETLFFGGLILSRPNVTWTVVCVTDGNADRQGAKRKRQFERACRRLGVRRAIMWDFADDYERRLSTDGLAARLVELAAEHGTFSEIYTHGALGEYGHPHHQDVGFAVHRVFEGHRALFGCAYNILPDQSVRLTRAQFAAKCEILNKIYGSETRRFLNLLPATSTEGFVRLKLSEVENLYRYFTGEGELNTRRLDRYRWMQEFLAGHRSLPRPF